MLGVSPEERLVLSIDLADYKDRDDFEARLNPASNFSRSLSLSRERDSNDASRSSCA
jgi:hypothetical protein